MDLNLKASKILLLDTAFTPNMLENNQAVVGEIEGKSVLMINVNLEDIEKQVRKQEKPSTCIDPFNDPRRDWFDIND
ncbi:hypothetical protein MKX29_13365 [Cytobacillus sp. FSL R7-0696]|uniref:hypothetical protein n=1 Tax=Cytobacillus sp. FSL R7-0696 TaxID=2921691 RepID=UPI0030FBB25E